MASKLAPATSRLQQVIRRRWKLAERVVNAFDASPPLPRPLPALTWLEFNEMRKLNMEQPSFFTPASLADVYHTTPEHVTEILQYDRSRMQELFIEYLDAQAEAEAKTSPPVYQQLEQQHQRILRDVDRMMGIVKQLESDLHLKHRVNVNLQRWASGGDRQPPPVQAPPQAGADGEAVPFESIVYEEDGFWKDGLWVPASDELRFHKDQLVFLYIELVRTIRHMREYKAAQREAKHGRMEPVGDDVFYQPADFDSLADTETPPSPPSPTTTTTSSSSTPSSSSTSS